MYIDNRIISEVERNQKLLRVGDILIYTDASNSESLIVMEKFEGGFICLDSENNDQIFYFNELQLGWEFSEKTKKYNSENFRLKYV